MKKLQPLDFIFSAAVLILGIFLTIKNISKKGSVVKVRLIGVCSSCKNASMTLKNFVESILKTKVDKNITVEQV